MSNKLSFQWLTSSADNFFDFSWVCGSLDHTTTESDILDYSSKEHIPTVWSGLEYEPSSDQDDMNQSKRGSSRLTSHRNDSYSIHSLEEPQERNSNMPILRELPSFGSTLTPNSLQSGIHPNSSGFSSYPTRNGSLDSATKRLHFFLKPPEESPLYVKPPTNNSNNNTSSATSTFFLLRPQ